MKPAFLALAGAAALSAAFAALEAAAFVAMLAAPILAASVGDARAGNALYRWKEPDGALTYSPTAPTDGRPYDKVDPMTLNRADEPADDARTAGVTAADAAPARPVRNAPRPLVTASETEAASTFTDMPPRGGTEDASAAGVPAAGVPATTAPALGAAADGRPATSGAAASEPAMNTSRAVASNDKEQRCGELAKRVVSLERRLATPLTPAAMDDTVVQMARYQQSAERHCR